MNDKELAELEDESTWDWDHAERLPPIESRRTVLAVAFNRDEMALITRRAEKLGITVVEYLRRRALKTSSR